MHAARRLAPVALVLALLVLLPAAAAQTIARPVQGSYTDVYIVAGRVLDASGEPFAGGRLTVELDQEGVVAEPTRATANCKGDFITFFNLKNARPGGRVYVTVHDMDGNPKGTTTAKLDPFFRRSDVIVHYDGEWNRRCPGEEDVWEVSVSVVARILNRTEPYMENEVQYEARPFEGYVGIFYDTPDGQRICPPLPNGPPTACETFVPDERGDVRYTFTLDRPFPAGGTVTLLLGQDRPFGDNVTTFNATVDPETRMALFHLEATGEGAPTVKESPAPPAAVAALVAVAVAGAFARRVKPRA